MFEIGSSLRSARESQGMSLADAEARTRIRSRYLEALEQDEFDSLPEEAYAKGFLRTYATVLGLDPQLYVAALGERLHPDGEEPPILAPARTRLRKPLRGVRPGAAVEVAAVAILVAVGATVWRLDRSPSKRPVGLPVAGSAPQAPTTAAAAKPHPSSTPTSKRPAAARAAVARPRLVHLVLTARGGACWVSARDGSQRGTIIWEGMLAPGQSVRLTRARLWLRLGAPGHLVAQLAGRPLAGLPQNTANIVVTPAGLRVVG